MASAAKVPALVTTPIVVVAAIFPVLSLISIFFRFKARRKTDKHFGSEDWWMLVSWIFTLSISINSWVFGGITGIDYYKIDPLRGTMYSAMYATTTSMLSQIALTTVKIAILLFYKRIFQTRKFKIAVWIAIFFISCWGIIFFLLDLLQGDPISEAWTAQGRVRIPTPPLVRAQVATSIGLDLVVLAFPLPLMLKLHLQWRKKVGLILIFWLGAFCVVAAIVRLVLLNEVVVRIFSSQAYTAISYQSKAQIFTILEPNCSIIAASLPCYAPLFKGKRSLGSMIASVRSAFTVFSSKSASSTDSWDEKTPMGSRTAETYKQTINSRSDLETANGSQVFAKTQTRGITHVYTQSVSSQHGSRDLNQTPENIMVTRDVEVARV